MTSLDNTTDSRFAEAEADVDYGSPWRFRDAGTPNPLTIVATEWSRGVTKLGEAEFLQGRDRDGKAWSILVGSVVLTKRLIDGTVEEWSDEQGEFVVVSTLGRVQPGEVVSIKYLGDVEGAKYTYPNFRVSRKPPAAETGDEPVIESETPIPEQPADEAKGAQDDDIPF